MKKNIFFGYLLLVAASLTSCGDSNSGLSSLGGGESSSTQIRQYAIFAPAEVIVGEPYSISLVDANGVLAAGATRLIITRGSTQISDTSQSDIPLYSHTPDQASVGQILNYTIYYNGNQYHSGSLVKAPEPEESQ